MSELPEDTKEGSGVSFFWVLVDTVPTPSPRNLTWLCLKRGNRRAVSNLLLFLLEDPIGGASLGARTVRLWASLPNSLGFCIPSEGNVKRVHRGDSKALVSPHVLLRRGFLRIHSPTALPIGGCRLSLLTGVLEREASGIQNRQQGGHLGSGKTELLRIFHNRE